MAYRSRFGSRRFCSSLSAGPKTLSELNLRVQDRR